MPLQLPWQRSIILIGRLVLVVERFAGWIWRRRDDLRLSDFYERHSRVVVPRRRNSSLVRGRLRLSHGSLISFFSLLWMVHIECLRRLILALVCRPWLVSKFQPLWQKDSPTRRSKAAGLTSSSVLSAFNGVRHFWQYILALACSCFAPGILLD